MECGLALPVAILVAVRVGQIIHQINSINMETEITNLAIDVLKEKIVQKLQIFYRVYKDTTPTGEFSFPTAVNFQEVAERALFSVDNIHWLNQIYLDLITNGTGSTYFVHILDVYGQIGAF